MESGKSPKSGIRGIALISRVTPPRNDDNRTTVKMTPARQSLAFNKGETLTDPTRNSVKGKMS